MKVELTVITAQNTKQSFLAELPTNCPVCRFGIQATVLHSGYLWGEQVMLMFRCPRAECSTAFVTVYNKGISGAWEVSYNSPQTLAHPERSRFIKDISTRFYTIYEQAFSAQHYKLDQICGGGYRKSLEFLIKDYLIFRAKGKEDEINAIKGKMLGPCIRENVDNERIKEVAARASWLGNDETHYLRKWETKDVSDLKRLIILTIHWIEMELETAEAMKDMPAIPKS